MKHVKRNGWLYVILFGAFAIIPTANADVKAWTGTITLPTYPWEEDINPAFWALAAPGAPTLIYPYTMQDYLWRRKEDRTYKALFLENEYLKVTCLPQLGGRIHSVLDKTTNQEMFHLNRVIKPSMIAMRGAWISGGVEWNAGPQGHTVTCVSPVNALLGRDGDAAFIEISNLEKTQRTRWTVRLTLHPGKAYLDERVRLFNPHDALSPYYFWNCTAFPNRPGTRFIFPMSLGTDHSGEVFFNWPVHEGRDLTWLKNHETWASIFAHHCVFDFFGAYDVEADRGIVQAADHRTLGGKKAWTWGQWEFGQVSQKNLTDEDGPYIEVQSGPLPTQLDYGPLWPRAQVEWREWWYPVHGLGDGFVFATRDVAIQTRRRADRLEARLLATGKFPNARCVIAAESRPPHEQSVDLTPERPVRIDVPGVFAATQVDITIISAAGERLAAFTDPLRIPGEPVPAPSPLAKKADADLTAEEAFWKGRKSDLASDRAKAREYYQMAISRDAGRLDAQLALAALDVEAAQYEAASGRLKQIVTQKPQDGLALYFLGVCQLRLGHDRDALENGLRASQCAETGALGHDLAGRAQMRLGDAKAAVENFKAALRVNPADTRAADHWLIARYTAKDAQVWADAQHAVSQRPTDLVPRALLALRSESERRQFNGRGFLDGDDLEKFNRLSNESANEFGQFVADVRNFVGEVDFEMIDVALVFANLGLKYEAALFLNSVFGGDAPPAQRSALPLYCLAFWTKPDPGTYSVREHEYLRAAATTYRDGEFVSPPEMLPILEYAVTAQPDDAAAHLHLGNLLAHLGRPADAVQHWQKAAELKSALSVAWRNLGLYARIAEKDLAKSAALYRKAIAARPSDQTLYRDAANVLIEAGRRTEAISLLETMPLEKSRRADVTILLARAYLDEKHFDEAIKLLESTPYIVAWEGQTTPWDLFNAAHLERGQTRFAAKQFDAALADFDAALTYPPNLGVGRSNKPPHAAAQYWRGKALQALGRNGEARRAWETGAAGGESTPEQNKHIQMCREALGNLP